MLQGASGSFAADKDLAQQLGISLEFLKSSSPKELSKDQEGEKIWATCLAINHLKLNHKETEEEWKLLSSKAKTWVGKNATKYNITTDSCLATAKQVLQSSQQTST